MKPQDLATEVIKCGCYCKDIKDRDTKQYPCMHCDVVKALTQYADERLEEAAKAINYQALDERHWTLPSNPVLNSKALDEYVGSIIRRRVDDIRSLKSSGGKVVPVTITIEKKK